MNFTKPARTHITTSVLATYIHSYLCTVDKHFYVLTHAKVVICNREKNSLARKICSNANWNWCLSKQWCANGLFGPVPQLQHISGVESLTAVSWYLWNALSYLSCCCRWTWWRCVFYGLLSHTSGCTCEWKKLLENDLTILFWHKKTLC